MNGGEERSSGKVCGERSLIGSLGMEGVLWSSLWRFEEMDTKFASVWCRASPLAVSSLQHFEHAVLPLQNKKKHVPCGERMLKLFLSN